MKCEGCGVDVGELRGLSFIGDAYPAALNIEGALIAVCSAICAFDAGKKWAGARVVGPDLRETGERISGDAAHTSTGEGGEKGASPPVLNKSGGTDVEGG